VLVASVPAESIDVAIAWGPLGGYFAQRAAIELTAAPIEPLSDSPFPMQFDVSMAVRHEDRALHAQLEEVLSRRRAEIDAVLKRYGVPLLPFRSR
jgi:mxaJ protein